jgi:hypothetical protein
MLAAILVAPYWAVLTWDESIGFTQVIGPLFAGFTTAIIRYFVKNPAVVVDHREAKVFFQYVVVSLLPTGMLVFLVAVIIVAYATNHSPANFEQVRSVIAGLEALFGVYVGYVLEDLFHYRAVKKR